MSKSFKALGLAVGALALTHLPAAAQTKVTNQGISADEIVIGTHQDLSGPIKVWGVPVSNGMKMAVEEINAAGGIHGRKLKMILEDSGYDPKRAVLASQKMVERDKVLHVRSGQAAGAAEVQQFAALRREHPCGGEIHGRAEGVQKTLHPASGR